MEDRSCIIPDFRPLGTPDSETSPATTLCGVFDGHMSAKAAEMAANNLHVFLSKGARRCPCLQALPEVTAAHQLCRLLSCSTADYNILGL